MKRYRADGTIDPVVSFLIIGPDEAGLIQMRVLLEENDTQSVGTLKLTIEQLASFVIALERDNIVTEVAFRKG